MYDPRSYISATRPLHFAAYIWRALMQESKSIHNSGIQPKHHLRFHARHTHLHRPFGGDRFGIYAERCARFFGTPAYVVAQTALVVVWIAINAAGIVQFDVYPFILLNLAF